MKIQHLKLIPKLARSYISRPRFTRITLRNVKHILSIACTGHGASIAYVGSNGVVRASVLDRWVGAKNVLMFSEEEARCILNPDSDVDHAIKYVIEHGFGKFPENRVFEEVVPEWVEWFLRGLDVKASDIDLIVTSDSHFATCLIRLGLELKRWFPSARVYRDLEHHRIHRCQAFWQSGLKEAAVLTLDTCGEDLRRVGGRKLSGSISIMSYGKKERVLKEFFFPQSSAGVIYDTVTQHIGFRQSEEGKTMGLAPYGEPELFEMLRDHLKLHDDGSFEFLHYRDLQAELDKYVPARKPGEELLQRHKNVAYAGQALVEQIVAAAFKAALRLTGQRDLVYAGGVGLNSVANEVAYQAAKPRHLYIATNPGDTGHALGCALFGAYELAHWPPPTRETPEYLGPPYSVEDLAAAAADAHGFQQLYREDCEQLIARCIANGYIIAHFGGAAEFGPRALGNRSIFCDPRRPDMKDYLNAQVKHREEFRPFAPIVLEEHASDWFELDGRSSYMLRVVPVRAEVLGRVPAIAHVDKTARVQTLSHDENPFCYRLINAFYELTGVPMLLNTSFNVAGKPIVETPANAVACFASTKIDVLALGPFIISKLPIEEYLNRPREESASLITQ
jgi:carbamoyltransferase